MIYDGFIYYNEPDQLEIRLNELYEVVDKFVLVEAKYTHSNIPKPLYFEENKERFAKFLDKIEHIVVENFDGCKCNWEREKAQRDAIALGFKDCKPDDVIIVSDSDEIPSKKALLACKDKPGIKVLEQLQYNFFLNYINSKERIWRRGPRVLFYKDFEGSADSVRYTQGDLIPDGGWHFTFLGGIKSVKNKIMNFSHQEYNTKYYLDEERLTTQIYEGKDIFERGFEYKIVDIDKTFPLYLRENKDKFNELLLKKPSVTKRISLAFKNISSKLFKTKIETYKSSNPYPITDFIANSSKNILTFGDDNDFINHLNITYPNATITPIKINSDLIANINAINNDVFDCVVFNNSFAQIYQIDKVIEIIKPKMTQNGYIVFDVPNIRYIEVLKTLLLKKQWENTKNVRMFTRKNIMELLCSHGYYFITLKGLNPFKNNILFNILNLITINGIYDSRHEKYLCQLKH